MKVLIVLLVIAVLGVKAAPQFYSEPNQQWKDWHQQELTPTQVKLNQYSIQPSNSNGFRASSQFQQWPQWQEEDLFQLRRDMELQWQNQLHQKPQNIIPYVNNVQESHYDAQKQPWGQWELEPPKQKPQQQPATPKPHHVKPNENKLPAFNSEFQQWLQQQKQPEQEPENQKPQQNFKPESQRQKPRPQIPQNMKPIDTEDFEDQPKFKADPRCPRIDNIKKPVHFPLIGDCSKFVKCVEGLAYEMDCPAGLEFGVGLNRCDYPAKAKCGINNGL